MRIAIRSLIGAAVFALSVVACASDQKASAVSANSKNEMMAGMHDQMAGCLRSGKSAQDCRAQVAQNCPIVENGNCPMMNEMMGSGGMMGKDMMGNGMRPGMMDQTDSTSGTTESVGQKNKSTVGKKKSLPSGTAESPQDHESQH
jgi:hypothetical protein